MCIFLIANAGAAVQAQTANIVSAEGQIVPQKQLSLAFQIGGMVETIFVAEGEAVQVGDPLLQLDPAAAELGLQQVEARLVTAQSGLTAAINEQTLAETAVQTAQARLDVAQANLMLVEAGPQPEQIAAAESRVAAAQAAITQAVGSRDAALDVADTSDILAAEAAVASAQAEVQQLEQAYQEILDSCFDTPQGELCPLFGPIEEQTRQQLDAARLNKQAAQAALEALQNGATPAQRQAANAQVGVAQANLAIVQAQLDLLLAGATPEQVRLAEVAVEQAQLAVRQAEVRIEQAVAGVAVAETAVSLAEAAVNRAELALERTFLRATFDGRVVSIALSEGEPAAPGFPALTLANFDSWQIETTDLTELDVVLVAESSSVTVRVDALPDEELVGVVTAVAFVPNLSRGDVVYTVTIDLLETAALPLRWGMTAFVDIDT
ncbi:HlyD family efflux transporter periplasmic adaptor subunit [Candidatus Leptofilum sp.]|uniref:HlyD family efflux transporter periplasmic adaptor subunit n=1 Tax=Candidatus Leptofilum sp. TaxID=3241576 RepID=UPI003B5C011B